MHLGVTKKENDREDRQSMIPLTIREIEDNETKRQRMLKYSTQIFTLMV